MKANTKNYREVTIRPQKALLVSEYAEKRNCNTSYIYKLYRKYLEEGKSINFEIIRYKGMNWVLEN